MNRFLTRTAPRVAKRNNATLRYDGRVAVVTGAGNGLGREYALALGARGATVVVNDFGGGMHGEGASSVAADEVVAQIKAAGGNAMANYANVCNTDDVLGPVMEEYGKLDILINNAGILRDRSFLRISDDDWQAIMDVHLTASFKLSQKAFEVMKAQKYGRIINTSSSSGIYGNFGQANYAAAKMGLVGLTNTLAIEGRKNNVLCNAVAPQALSRMTENIFPADLHEMLGPQFVAPLTLYLCHEDCDETGGVFETGGGYSSKLRFQSTKGALFATKAAYPTVEDVAAKFDEICNFDDEPEAVESIHEATMRIMNAISEMPDAPEAAGDDPDADIQPNKAKAWTSDIVNWEYTHKDVILYNLGVGAGPMKDNCELRFIYENHDEFQPLPSFAIVPAFKAIAELGETPGLKVNLANILHGEQYIKLHKPFDADGAKLSTTAKVGDILDKGKHLVYSTDYESRDEDGELVCTNQFVTFVRNQGGFGGTNRQETIVEPIDAPDREPDHTFEESVPLGQAALYRLSGDPNPLHLDPDFAQMAGFKVPILHGMCTYGYAVRHIQNQYPETPISAIKGRFSSPVLPGDILVTKMWKDGEKVLFEVWNKESNVKAISGGFVEFGFEESEKSSGSSESSRALLTDKLFADMTDKVDASSVNKVKGIFKFEIMEDGKLAKSWVVDLKNGEGSVLESDGKADCTIIVSDSDFAAIAAGELDAQKAFFGGQMKIKGNVMLSQKLGSLLK